MSQARIEFREDVFNVLAAALGAHNDTTRAELLGVHPRTLARARRGVLGADFMTCAVAAFAGRAADLDRHGLDSDVTLDRLFRVVLPAAVPA